MDNRDLIAAIGDMMDKKLEQALEPISQRLGKLEQEIHQTNLKIELVVEPRIDAIVAGQDLIREKLAEHDVRFARIDARFDQADARFDQIDKNFDFVKTALGAHEGAINELWMKKA